MKKAGNHNGGESLLAMARGEIMREREEIARREREEMERRLDQERAAREERERAAAKARIEADERAAREEKERADREKENARKEEAKRKRERKEREARLVKTWGELRQIKAAFDRFHECVGEDFDGGELAIKISRDDTGTLAEFSDLLDYWIDETESEILGK